MLKKMRRRFITSAMAAFGSVLLVLIIGINLVSFFRMTASQDAMLRRIREYDASLSGKPEESRPPIQDMLREEPEGEFTTRFFSVNCDEEGNITVFGRDFIESVDEAAAEAYTEKVLSGGREKGFCGDYRYMVFQEEEGKTIIFLNIANDSRFQKSLVIISALVGMTALSAVFILIMLFSGRAIRPYIRSMEQQKQFITDAGHELKTPITSIATSADIAAMEHENDRWITNIQNQTARLTKLTNQLVTLSRLDEETPFPEKKEFSLSDAAWEAAELFYEQFQNKKIRYSQSIEDGLTIRGDRESVQRLFSILLENALLYTEEEGEIRLRVYRKRKHCFIEVYNTCILTDTENLDRLFDRFFRPDSSRSSKSGGSGIGLSIAKSIAESHGGTISAASGDGRSILFTVRF